MVAVTTQVPTPDGVKVPSLATVQGPLILLKVIAPVPDDPDVRSTVVVPIFAVVVDTDIVCALAETVSVKDVVAVW